MIWHCHFLKDKTDLCWKEENNMWLLLFSVFFLFVSERPEWFQPWQSNEQDVINYAGKLVCVSHRQKWNIPAPKHAEGITKLAYKQDDVGWLKIPITLSTIFHSSNHCNSGYLCGLSTILTLEKGKDSLEGETGQWVLTNGHPLHPLQFSTSVEVKKIETEERKGSKRHIH